MMVMKKIQTKSKQSNQGFTLIELLVVISIIALLSSVLLYAMNSARVKARNSKRVSDVNQIAKGLELFYSTCGTYPALPPITFGIRLDQTKGLFTGTVASCNAGDATYGSNGISPNGGIGTTHAAASNETLFISSFPAIPVPIDNGSLTVGNRCTENNSQTGYKWGEYSFVSFAPADPNQYWLYFCISDTVGNLAAGRYIMTEKGLVKYSGNLFP